MTAPPAALEVSNITKRFGGLTALSGVSFSVPLKGIVGLIGPNGSGKTTLFNVIGGQLRPEEGSVSVNGRPMTGARPHDVAAAGVGRTFQIPRLFRGMTVRENVLAATHLRGNVGILRSMFRVPPITREERALAADVDQILAFTGLTSVAERPAKELSSGHTRLLEVARALGVNPQLVMLDEPAAGLSLDEVEALAGCIRDMQGRGLTVLVVEHNVRFVMNVCERIVVLSEGHKLAEGVPEVIRNDSSVIDAYLGRT